MQEGKHIELKEKALPLHQQKMLTEQVFCCWLLLVFVAFVDLKKQRMESI